MTAQAGAVPEAALHSPIFWIGIVIWALGFMGNIYSDEILYDLRRPNKDGSSKPRYSVPHGFLYSKPFGGISFPAYFCEWIEWSGFALAATCLTMAPALPVAGAIGEAVHAKQSLINASGAAFSFLRNRDLLATPPFLFIYAEVLSKLIFLDMCMSILIRSYVF
jgi:3-oxo-5-alpha-steroid 4-dehydrogenase 1